VKLIDDRLREQKLHFLLQSLAGTAAIAILLLIASAIDSAVVVASLGASVFICMSSPHARTSSTRYLIGGYLCGCIAGLVGYACEVFLPAIPHVIVAAMAVGFSFLLMVVFNFEHPPAAALALGLVLSPYTLNTVAIALLCICLLAIAMHFARPHMKDLL
jgi:CBS-domain-containing membrane protein